jgi:DNA-binding SARP family transcriptional activator/WD40 repeat protein/energy-coupling factor transporter ATP-binding protein EcfA2
MGSPATLEFRLLGPLEVWLEGRPLRLGGQRQRALLALLLLHANEVVPSARLIEELFGGDSSETGANALQVGISRLRRLLGERRSSNGDAGVLVTRPPGYLLRAEPEQLDVALFERLLGEGRQALMVGDAVSAAATLREALALWRGPALADLALLEFAQPEIRRLEELRLSALMERIEADLALGGAGELIPELEALVEANPLHERLRGQLMLALYRSGRQADALEVYRQTREFLRNELGLEPSKALQELERSILRQEPALDVEAGPSPAEAEAGAVVCPFKGLAPFDVADAEFFFGRERVIADLVARLTSATFVGVVGASGSGKSSLVRAGLLPALAAGGLPGSERWRLALVRPGRKPCSELERVLGDQVLLSALDGLRPGERLVLAVDQLEEAFTACEDAEERAVFLSTIAEAAADRDRRAVVVVSLRADFYGRLAAYPRFAELLSQNHVLLGPMERDELGRAIELPAKRAGLHVEQRLADALVADVADEPGALPFLSTMLLELWRLRETNVLRLETYRAAGGVRGAIARLAEQVYRQLSESEQRVARTMLLRLAAGEGSAALRRRVPLDELDLQRREELRAVLGALTEARLLTISQGTVEVSHEALLREWPRLRDWLEEDREGRRLHQELIERAREWHKRERDRGDLYRGVRLASALEWAAAHEQELNETERQFLAASRQASQQALRRLRTTAAALAALLGLAVVGGIVALVQRHAARREARVALANQLGAQALVEPRIDRALLLALEAVNLNDSRQTRGALLTTLLRTPAIPRKTFTLPLGTRPLRIDVSSDGGTLAVSDNSGQIHFFDTRTRRESRAPLTDAMGYVPPVYSADGEQMLTIAAGEPPHGLQLLDAATLRRLRLFPFDRTWFSKEGGAVTPFGLSRDGKTAFFAYDLVINEANDEGAAYVDVWEVASGKRRSRSLGSADLTGARLVGDGSRLVTVTRTEIATWDTRTLRRLSAVHPDVELGGYAGVSGDGRTVAAELRGSGALVFIDAASGRVIRARGGGDHGLALSVRFSPDDRTVVSSHDDGTVIIWNPATGRPAEKLVGHAGSSVGAAFSPDGAALYTSSLDGAIFEWGIGGERRFGQKFHYGPRARSLPDVPQTPPLAVAPDGSQFAVRVGRSRLALYSLPALQRRAVIAASTAAGPITALAWSADGTQLALATREGRVQLWDARPRPRLRRRLTGLDAVQALAFAPNQRLLGAVDHDRRSGGAPGRLALWRTDTGKVRAMPLELPAEGRSIAFSPSGDTIAVGLGDGRVLVIDAATRQVEHALHPTGAPNVAVTFAPDGTLLTGSWAGTVQRWDAGSADEIGRATIVSAGPVGSISFGRDTGLFATAGLADGRAKLWANSPLQQLGSSFHHPPNAQAGNVAMTADGKNLIVVYDDGSGAIWPLAVDAWKRLACTVAGRNLTREEWSRFIIGRSYRATCRSGET